MDNDDPLAKFRGVLPSRAELCQWVLFGTSEKIRTSAQSVLDLLPPMTAKEKGNWASAVWGAAKMPSTEDMAKSPVGKATLEMLRNSKPVAVEKTESVGNPTHSSQAGGTESVGNPTVSAEPVEPVNEHLQKISWPPQGKLLNQPPKDPEDDDTPHKWQAAKPSPPDKSLRPISDWDSPDGREPMT